MAIFVLQSGKLSVSEIVLVRCPSAGVLEVMLVLCMNLCCMCSVSKTSLCPLLLLSPWHCYPLTSSKAMVCTNTNCCAPPSPPLSPHTYTLLLGESDSNITEDNHFPLQDMESCQLREFLTRFNSVMNFSGVFHSLPFPSLFYRGGLLPPVT